MFVHEQDIASTKAKRQAKKQKLDSDVAQKSLNKGLKLASKVTTSKLDSDVAQKSLNKGLDLASQVIKGKTFRKQKAISIAKNVKASVTPQPDSAVTSVKKRVPKAPKAVVLPVKTSGVRGRGRKAITA
jgi:hypothetical protein